MLILTFDFPIFFSYRVPGYSSQYALSSLFPGPSTIKLGIVATTIEYFGIEKGKEIFEKVKGARIGIIPPKVIVVNNFLIKRLKAQKEFFSKKLPSYLEDLQQGKIKVFSTFESTYVIRGYVQYSEPLKVVIESAYEKEIRNVIHYLGRVGSYDSLVYCSFHNDLDGVDTSKIVWSVNNLENSNGKKLLIQSLRDIDESASFEDINAYSENRKSRRTFLRNTYYLVPIKGSKRYKNSVVYYLDV